MTRADGERIGVVGAGLVGLAVAREVLLRRPGAQVTVFEKEDRVAAHQSGHNSNVLHAGLYYRPGSLKAVLCRRGGAMLREFCAEHGVALRELGKVVVATTPAELSALDEIETRARANGVPGLRRLDRPGLREVEPRVQALGGLHSPHTAAVDYPGVAAALARDVTARGGEVLLGTGVDAVTAGTGTPGTAGAVGVRSGEREWWLDRLVVCAGLQADRFAEAVRAAGDLRIVPFRGEYYELRPQARDLVRGMVYPVPDPRYPFLGVHLTRDLAGGVHVGPNAVLALALEGYRRRDVSGRDLRRVATWPGAWRLARRHWRAGASELAGSLSVRAYLQRARAYLPELTAADLVPAGAGVRAQAVRRDGTLVDDFELQTAGPVTLVRNAPSPAATSCLAIAERIVAALPA